MTVASSAAVPPASGADPETRERILQAGMECFARFGRSKTTLQDVAMAAGLSRATLYRYFADRRELLTAVRDHEEAREAAEIARRLSAVDGLAEAVAVVATVIAATAARYRVTEHVSAGDLDLARFVTLTRDRRREQIARLLLPHVERAAAEGRLRVGVDEAVEWIALVVGLASGLPSVDSVDSTDPGAVGAWFGRLCCDGLLAPTER